MVAYPPFVHCLARRRLSLAALFCCTLQLFCAVQKGAPAGEPQRIPAATEKVEAGQGESAFRSGAVASINTDSHDAGQRSNPYGAYGRPSSTAHPEYVDSGEYRQPVDIKFLNDSTALITTKLSGELWELKWSADDHARNSLERVYRDADCSWGELTVIDPHLVAVTESRAEQVVLFHKAESGWEKVLALDTPGLAHSLLWDGHHHRLLASGQWSQQLYRWQATPGDLLNPVSWRKLPSTDLRMCGGEMLLLSKQKLLLITDAFGSNYRLLDRESAEVVKSDRVYGHNISGLAAARDETMVLFPHQLISETAPSVQGEITWGGVLSNNLRWLKIDRMRQQSGHDIIRQGRFYPLGTNGDGCGDPSSLAVSSAGLLAITLGGTNRVAIVTEDEYYFRQVDVGYRPVACQFTPDEQWLVVVNQFSDSLSLVRLSDDYVQHLSLGAVRPPTKVERGEQAFFNSSLSHDGWMSCHSCHSHGHTSGQLNDNQTDKSFGSPKRILSLLGQAETAPYSWNAHLKTLEDQVAHSINSTMAADHAADPATVADIAAFIRTLPAPPSLAAARRLKAERSQMRHRASAVAEVGNISATGRGSSGSNVEPTAVDYVAEPGARSTAHSGRLFRELGCVDCHTGRWLTSPETYDVGLADESQQRWFNPPSLIGVSQRQDVLLHDGRASSLRDLLQNHPHQLPRALIAAEIDELVTYLEGL